MQADVVVVGGGPTGLLLASELALAGVNVTLLERRVGSKGQSRALGMHARSLEVLALRGIAHRFVERGVPSPIGHYAGLETVVDFSKIESSHPFALFLPQTITEELLLLRAIELGVDLRRGWEVETVVETKDGIKILGVAEQRRFEIEAHYLVGADGARSTIRDQAAIPFTGKGVDLTLYFGDVVASGITEVGLFTKRNEEGAVMGAPIGGGHYRLVFIDPKRFSVPLSTPVTLEEVQDGARRMIGPNVVVSNPTWLSRFGDETRLADHYRKGRIFLAGDAAHIHLPAGGQGMNTGLQDAMNLGWKLAGVVRKLAPEVLLDTYELERRPVGQELINNTLAQSACLSASGPEGGALRKSVNELLAIPAANRYIAGKLSALDIRYPAPLMMGYEAGNSDWTGVRLPDVKLRIADGATTTLYALLHEAYWVDLRLEEEVEAPPIPRGIATSWVRTVYATLLSENSSLHALASVVARPDGHVAFAKTKIGGGNPNHAAAGADRVQSRT